METDQPYIIHLEVKDTIYLQTGYYRCVDNSTTDLEDGAKVTSIYVYVKSKATKLVMDFVLEISNCSIGYSHTT